MKFIKGLRTVAFMAAVIVVGGLQQGGWVAFIPPQYQGIGLAFVGFCGIVLRYLTTTPIGAKQ